MPRVLVAKTSIDGHWRGVDLVSRVLRDAGFEVIMLGMAVSDVIATSAVHEDVDLVGLNIGGRVEVAERTIKALRDAGSDAPIMAGGTIAPWARRRLEELGVEVFPPGSKTDDIVAAARRLCNVTEP
ncbi:MAG: cobalamin B12-binding domain-containing protein [Acidimicrobiales bacterium]